MACTSPEKIYNKVDDFLSIKFDSVSVDSAYLARGFENAALANDSIKNDSNDEYENITLESLDKMDTQNKVIYEPVIEQQRKKVFKPPRKVKQKVDNSFNRQYIDFQREVFKAKVLLKIIDTTKKK